MEMNEQHTQSTAPEQEPSATEALAQLLPLLRELSAYAGHFISAKLDSLQLSMRQIAVWTILGILAAITLCSVIVTSTVLALSGMAGGVSEALDGELWLGNMVVGILLLVILALGTLIGMRMVQRNSRKKKVQQYVERQLQQRATFGRNVADRATDPEI